MATQRPSLPARWAFVVQLHAEAQAAGPVAATVSLVQTRTRPSSSIATR
jgi:hypothetical protein